MGRKLIPISQNDIINLVTNKKKRGEYLNKTLEIVSMPVISKDDMLAALERGKEVMMQVQTVVSQQVQGITAKILCNLHMGAQLPHCSNNHPTVYYLGPSCPVCDGKIQFTDKHTGEDKPTIIGKIISDTERIAVTKKCELLAQAGVVLFELGQGLEYDKLTLFKMAKEMTEESKNTVIDHSAERKNKLLCQAEDMIMELVDGGDCPICHGGDDAHITGSSECKSDCRLNALLRLIKLEKQT